MARETKFIVYVDKDILDKPSELFDAAIGHFIKKGLDIQKRRRFIQEFMKAEDDTARIAVLSKWASYRDVTTFPFKKEEDEGEDEGVEGGVPVDDGAVEEQE